MKAGLFSYSALVALVLFVAAVPSRATERRDPVLNPGHTASGHTADLTKSAHSSHPKKSSRLPAKCESQDKNLPRKSPDGGAGSSSKGK